MLESRQNNTNKPKRPPLDAGGLSQPTPSPDVRTWDDFYPGRAHLRHGENKITYSFDSLAAGLRWVDGSYLLFVEPRLIGNLDVVSVRVADVCREVVGTPFGPKARFLVGSSSRVHRRPVAGPDSVRALGGESDVKIFGDFAILQPETRIAIDRETVQLIELVGHVDAKRLKQLLVKFARPFQVRDGEINMVNHGFLFSFDCDSPISALLNPDPAS